jgi:hypothetical protein
MTTGKGRMNGDCMSLFEYLNENSNNFNDHDLAVLSDWANDQKNTVPSKDWKKAYSLIREGADLLLRRRARSKMYQEMTNICVPMHTGTPPDPYEPHN